MADTATDRLRAAADAYWQQALEADPAWATAIGDRHLDDRLGDPSPAGVAARRDRLAAIKAAIDGLDPADLDPEERITRSSLATQVAGDLADLDADWRSWSVNPIDGALVAALNLAALQPVASVEQGRAMVARWNALGPWFDAHAENLRRSAAAGRVAVRSPLGKVLDQLDETLAAPADTLPLLAPIGDEHPDWPAGDRASFAADLRRAVDEVVLPAIRRYRATLHDDVLPIARPDERPGIAQLPGGDAAYEQLIQVHTSLPLAADAVHAIGLAEVERVDEELRALGAWVLGTGDLATIHHRLRDDPALHFRTADEVFDTAQGALERALAAIPAWFGIQPRAACRVLRMARHEEQHSTIAYYRVPAADGSRPGEYWINTSEPTTRPRYEAEALAFHEAVPGHHLQAAVAQELEHLPAFRRHGGPTAYIEGWGLYTERLADEMGLYTADLDRIGVLSFDGWRACRLVVDTGLHALGWTRRQAIDFMTDHTALAANNIANEIDRYIVLPGQALAYTIGQREILRLRAAAEATLGDRFDIRGFHDAVLGHGAVGLTTLAEIVGAWIETRRSTGDEGARP